MSTATGTAARAAQHFAHPDARVESREIGRGTRVWAFAHVLPGARVGEDCNICDHTFIEAGASVGDRVTIKCGVQLWSGVTLEDDVFVGSNTELVAPVTVRRGATIGAGSTITREAPEGQLTLARAKQVSVPGWTRPGRKRGAAK